MCNLKEKTDLKTVTVYKAVEKIDGKYYSYFAGTLIKVGTVEPQSIDNIHKSFKGRFLEGWSWHHNKDMVGKCSGFKIEDDARILAESDTVIKIKLSGEIWIGDATNIDSDIDDDAVIYAGTEIQSFEEI